MKLRLKVDLEFDTEQLTPLLKVIDRRTRSMIKEFEEVVMEEAYVSSIRSTMKTGTIEIIRISDDHTT